MAGAGWAPQFRPKALVHGAGAPLGMALVAGWFRWLGITRASAVGARPCRLGRDGLCCDLKAGFPGHARGCCRLRGKGAGLDWMSAVGSARSSVVRALTVFNLSELPRQASVAQAHPGGARAARATAQLPLSDLEVITMRCPRTSRASIFGSRLPLAFRDGSLLVSIGDGGIRRCQLVEPVR